MDKHIVKKLMTHKSGQFILSNKYDQNKLSPYIIQASILNETIRDMPILPDIAASLNEELMIRSIFSTAAIEGNPLRHDEVSQIILKKEDALNDKEKEICNLKQVYDLIDDSIPHKRIISEDFIKIVHSTITAGINYKDNTPGKYRNHSVKVGDEEHGGTYTPPKILEDIRTLMDTFLKWFNIDLQDENCFIQSALTHLYLALIHPFGQGNGRSARAIESLILNAYGIRYVPKMLSNYYYRNIDEYYWAFSNTIKSLKSKECDVTDFLEFAMKGIVESFRELKDRNFWHIKRMALRDFCGHLLERKGINARQHMLISLILNGPFPFSLKDLFNKDLFRPLYVNVSERTARRDVEALSKMGLLVLQEDDKFIVNLNLLTS